MPNVTTFGGRLLDREVNAVQKCLQRDASPFCHVRTLRKSAVCNPERAVTRFRPRWYPDLRLQPPELCEVSFVVDKLSNMG